MPNRVIAIAKAETGYLEKQTNSQLDDKTANAGYNNFTKYARDLALWGVYNGSKQGFAWCDQFIDYCMIMAYGLDTALKMTGQAKGGYGAGCTESANYYKAIGRFYTSKPQVGDQIFFTSDGGKTMYHTGLVWKVAETMVYTIEGNTSSTLGVVDNGGGVFEKYYMLTSSKIGGYGRPDYSLVPAENETEDEEEVVRYNKLSDIPNKYKFRDVIEVLMNAQIINGDGSDPDGNDDVIDLSHDQVRSLIFNYRAGAFDRKLMAMGMAPVVEI